MAGGPREVRVVVSVEPPGAGALLAAWIRARRVARQLRRSQTGPHPCSCSPACPMRAARS